MGHRAKPPRTGIASRGSRRNIARADVVGITGTSFMCHTIERLLELSQHGFVVILGTSTLLSPVLFDYRVDVPAGVKVVESEKVIRFISQCAIFKQVEGVKLVTMAKERK